MMKQAYMVARINIVLGEDYDCNITMSAGLGIDGRVTAGLDIRDYWEADENTDQRAPKKPSKLTFFNGELEDTENNKYTVDDITSHMKGVTKDMIKNMVPVDKKVKESVEIEEGNMQNIDEIVNHIKRVLKNNKCLSLEKIDKIDNDEVSLSYGPSSKLIDAARPSMEDVVRDTYYELSVEDEEDHIYVELVAQMDFSSDFLESAEVVGKDYSELDKLLLDTLSEESLLDNAQNNDTWE